MTPWSSVWWPEIVRTAERGGSTAQDIIDKVSAGHAMGWPVEGGFLVLERTEDDYVRIWIGCGVNVRSWWREAEIEVSAFAKEIGCKGLRLEGRKGWRRILPHWERVGEEDLVLHFK
jgi:hypothetical protein